MVLSHVRKEVWKWNTYIESWMTKSIRELKHSMQSASWDLKDAEKHERHEREVKRQSSSKTKSAGMGILLSLKHSLLYFWKIRNPFCLMNGRTRRKYGEWSAKTAMIIRNLWAVIIWQAPRAWIQIHRIPEPEGFPNWRCFLWPYGKQENRTVPYHYTKCWRIQNTTSMGNQTRLLFPVCSLLHAVVDGRGVLRLPRNLPNWKLQKIIAGKYTEKILARLMA